MFRKIRERMVWKEVVKGLKNHKLFRGLILNSIKHEACMLMLSDKISFEFYENIFCNKKTDISHPWFELNEEKILNYYK